MLRLTRWLPIPAAAALVLTIGAVSALFAKADVTPTERPEQLSKAQLDIIFTQVGVDWRWPTGGSTSRRYPNELLDVETWYLLAQECRDQVGKIAAEKLDEFLQSRGLGDTELAKLAERAQCTATNVIDTLGGHLLIQTARKKREALVKVTDKEVWELIHATGDRATILLLLLRGDGLVDRARDIPEAELQEVFERYRFHKFDPENGRIGYAMGSQIRVEYIGFDFDEIIDHIRMSDDKIQAIVDAGFFDKQRGLPKDFKQKRDEYWPKVVYQVKADRARKLIAKAAEKLSAFLQKPWDKAEVLEKFKVAPKQVKAPEYWDSVTGWAGKNIGLPIRSGKTDWFTKRSVTLEAPELGKKLRFNAKGEPIKFTFAAFEVQGLSRPEYSRFPEFLLALYEPVPEPVVTKYEGLPADVFFFRVVGAKPPAVAGSVDQVRKHVIRDARLLRAVDAVEPYAQRLTQAARKVGLQAAFAEDTRLTELFGSDAAVRRVGPFTAREGQSLQRMQLTHRASLPTRLKGLRQPDAVVDAAFDLAKRARAGELRGHPVTTVKLVDGLAWGVVELLEHSELVPDDPVREVAAAKQKLREEKLHDLRRNLVSRIQVRRRAQTRAGSG